MAYWRCNGIINGSISFASRHRTPVVGGYFQASDSPALEARLLRLGHLKVTEAEALGAVLTASVPEPEPEPVNALDVALEPSTDDLRALCVSEGVKTSASTVTGLIAALERNDVDWQTALESDED